MILPDERRETPKLDALAEQRRNRTSVAYVASVARWPTLSPEALYGLPGEFVHLVEPHSEADPAALLVQFLVATGNLIGRGPYFPVEADRHGLNLFAVMVGDTSKWASIGARETWRMRVEFWALPFNGMVSETTISSRSEASIFSMALPERTGWVQ